MSKLDTEDRKKIPAEKDAAWKRIKTAAKKFGVEMEESSRGELKPAKRSKGKK